ncbi:hypothetical protein [Deinococcus budaensis]|uniref:Uncharacterized protein n=1 Tax=Deinococcus budaensis TaxID=1665626 RepID=A0A7W8GF49_9DEIO|nr:hypothetical protein [Deinococcus budaensis]MBB5234209.1 hypothetical protein [Deinococcus budaensis]
MMAKVFHARGPGAQWPDDFVLVAEVERCTDPDMAFRVVQHFSDSHWARGSGVRCLVPQETARSTRPGDVVELNGEVLECMPGTGWRRLE